jgi:chromosome segregation ATPase
MQNLREQTSEMGHRAREAKERCEALEEELSEAHKLLSERSREAGTMRRLLDEAEGREAGRIKEAREKMEAAMEERDQLEEEITLLRRNNAEGSGELTRTLREKELAVRDLTNKYEKVKNEMDELVMKNKDVEIKLQQARKEADEATFKLNNLSKSLVSTLLNDVNLLGANDSTNTTTTTGTWCA